MATRDPRATYLHIRALADDPRTPAAERANAQAAAARLEARYGPDAVEAPAAEGAEVVTFANAADHDLAVRIAAFYGLDTFRKGYARGDGKGTRWRDQVEIRGPADLVELAAASYRRHRAILAEILRYTAGGYTCGAFPMPPSERAENPDELPDHLVDAFHAASRAGQSLRDRRALTDRSPE